MLQNLKSSVCRWSAYCLLALVAVASSADSLFAQALLPDIGVDVDSRLSEAGTNLGTSVTVVIGIGLVLIIVARAISWFKGGNGAAAR